MFLFVKDDSTVVQVALGAQTREQLVERASVIAREERAAIKVFAVGALHTPREQWVAQDIYVSWPNTDQRLTA